MDKNIKIIIPFNENREVHILLVLKIFLLLREMSLEDIKQEVEKFRNGEDVVCFIDRKNLSAVKEWMQPSGYYYQTVIHPTGLDI